MRIALASLNQKWHDKDANFGRCAELVASARASDCDIVIFPEMTLTSYSMEVASIAEPKDHSPSLRRMGELSHQARATIVFGACLVPAPGRKARNELCVAGPDGTSRTAYAKVHPFSFAGEHHFIEGGDALGMLAVENVKFGLSICYDLRFPELYAAMARRCAGVITIANWPARRIAHWRALLVARAIENQFYSIGVNRTGVDGNGLDYEKSSMIVRPDGSILAPEIAGEELDVYCVDLELVATCRGLFPTVADKRRELYREFFAVP